MRGPKGKCRLPLFRSHLQETGDATIRRVARKSFNHPWLRQYGRKHARAGRFCNWDMLAQSLRPVQAPMATRRAAANDRWCGIAEMPAFEIAM